MSLTSLLTRPPSVSTRKRELHFASKSYFFPQNSWHNFNKKPKYFNNLFRSPSLSLYVLLKSLFEIETRQKLLSSAKKTWVVGFVTHKKNNYKQVYWVKNYQSLKILDAQKILLLCREDKAKLSLNCMSHLVLLWLSALFMADTIVDQYFNGYIDIATFIFGSRFKSKLLESNRRLLIW